MTARTEKYAELCRQAEDESRRLLDELPPAPAGAVSGAAKDDTQSDASEEGEVDEDLNAV